MKLTETDADGNSVYVVDEFGDLLLDWKGDCNSRTKMQGGYVS